MAIIIKAMIMSNDENKRQRKRSVFHLEQIRQLEYVFDKITHYPDLSLRQQLTLLTQLPDKKIQVYSTIQFIDSDLFFFCIRFGFKIVVRNGVNNIN
jgi:hypothetical protein